MSQASHYLDVLSMKIGPRPVASDTEREAAEWLQDQFTNHGVSAEIQDFETVHSPSGARNLCYLLVPLAVFLIGASFLSAMWVIHWVCWALLAALAVGTLLDLFGPKGPAGLISLLPKGPSQNVVAKSIPTSYAPGENPKKVILVANYDTAQTSPLSAESLAPFIRPLQAIANAVVIGMPIPALFVVLDTEFFHRGMTWVMYVLLALCIPGAILLINGIIARIIKRHSPGANNNASGIAALFSVLEKLEEKQQGHTGHTSVTSAVKLAAAEAKASERARQSSKMPGVDYEPGSGAGLGASIGTARAAQTATGRFPAATTSFESVGEKAEASAAPLTGNRYERMENEARAAAEAEAATNSTDGGAGRSESKAASSVPERERFVDFESVEFSGLTDASKVEPATTSYSGYAAMDDYDAQDTFAEAPSLGKEVLDASIIGAPAEDGDVAEVPAPKSADFEVLASLSEKEDNPATRTDGGTGMRTEDPPASDFESASKGDATLADSPPADGELGGGSLPPASIDMPLSRSERRSRKTSKATTEDKPKKKFFASFGKRRKDSHHDDPADWLGLGDGFDARSEGRAIGSWDNFGGQDGVGSDAVDLTDSFAPLGGTGGGQVAGAADTSDAADSGDLPDGEDPFAWKGGFAGDDPIEDSSYASAEAARIRRKVVESLDVELKEKEVWFVCTGARYAERGGIRAFMQDNRDELRGALFINLESLGSGDLYWSTKERFGRAHQSSARLTSMLRRLSRETQIKMKPWKKRSLITDAGPILAANGKAVTITRLTEKGVPFAMASPQDTPARLDVAKIDEVADIVCDIIREA